MSAEEPLSVAGLLAMTPAHLHDLGPDRIEAAIRAESDAVVRWDGLYVLLVVALRRNRRTETAFTSADVERWMGGPPHRVRAAAEPGMEFWFWVGPPGRQVFMVDVVAGRYVGFGTVEPGHYAEVAAEEDRARG
jgi:hypothetical protein